MYVRWNEDQPGFQPCWLWQFGYGPFEVLKIYRVPTKPNFLGHIAIKFEPGHWYYIAVPQAAYQYRVEYGLKAVLFHEMWFLPDSPKP